MEKHVYPMFGETLYTHTLHNGLRIQLFHKPEYYTNSVLLGVGYGAIDSRYVNAHGEHFNAPHGTAHFLEHKLFENEEVDALLEFSDMGADANAYTSYEETAYYFDYPGRDLKRPLELLLGTIQELHINEESVEREKEIILEERKMYMMDPESRLSYETFRLMYDKNPVRYDITGDEDSIRDMTAAMLAKVYAIHYHPSNMRMVIVTGNDPEEVIDWIEENQAKKTFGQKSEWRVMDETDGLIHRHHGTLNMHLNETSVCTAFRLPLIKAAKEEMLRYEWALDMALSAHLTSMNPMYETWIAEGKISPFFQFDRTCTRSYACLECMDQNVNAKIFEPFIKREAEYALTHKVNEEQLLQMKKAARGALLRNLNHPSRITLSAFDTWQRDMTLFEEMDMVEQLSAEEILQRTKELAAFDTVCMNLH